MAHANPWTALRRTLSAAIVSLAITLPLHPALAGEEPTPAPLLGDGRAVDWWFVFKLNAGAFPECGDDAERACPFGGEVQDYRYGWGQHYLYASSAEPELKKGGGCVGDSEADPLGATFERIWSGGFNFVVWNDQFYEAPKIKGCSKSCGAPWGHSKGVVAWNDEGEGVLIQVTTPSWPGAAAEERPRDGDGNTLGCVTNNNVKSSQHFFALRLSADDLEKVLAALANASVATDINNPQLARNGGPEAVQALVEKLGVRVKSEAHSHDTLSTGVQLISKPSKLHVPPWQLVSAALGGPDLHVANWWAQPKIPSTTDDQTVGCWNEALGDPGAVVNATEGSWQGVEFSLLGGPGKNRNHAKFGVTTGGERKYAIFGDMNQQGALSEGDPEGKNCGSSQNGRGGTFFVIDNAKLNAAVGRLIGADGATQ